MQYEVTSNFSLLGQPFVAGDQIKVERIWSDYGYPYCTVVSPTDGRKDDFSVIAVTEMDVGKLIILGLSPAFSIDDSVTSCFVLKLLGPEMFEIIPDEMLDRVSTKCLAAAKMSQEDRSKAVLDFFKITKS